MERKYDINLRELNDHGIQFKTYEEAKLFSEILEKELKDRFRSEIHKDLNWKKRDEFDKCAMVDEECLIEWLEGNYPDYRSVLKAEQEKLICEILEFRDEIPGLIFEVTETLLNTAAEDLGISARGIRCLEHAGIKTLADILDHNNQAYIRNLEGWCKKEVLLRVWEAIDSDYHLLEPLSDDDDDEYGYSPAEEFAQYWR